MDIVVKGRNVEVPEHYRVHVAEKLERLSRYDRKVIRFDVELFHEPNRRQTKNCQRVEITGKGKGPAVRAEATASDFYAALDCAVTKLENRLRRQHDRRKVHYGKHSPESVAVATTASMPELLADMEPQQAPVALMEAMEEYAPYGDSVPEPRGGFHEGPGRIAREKEHSAKPMSADQALSAMELVGHDFYLYLDIDSGLPSVVYRRHAFDYGVIRLVDH